ncbi:MAG: CapA family protein [Clostridiales bacterium]|nr:CapA family protein [Clostridiales bacterium]
MKRFLALLLAIALVLIPMFVFADEEIALFEVITPEPEIQDIQTIEQQPSAEILTQIVPDPIHHLQPDGSIVLTISAVGDLTIGGDVRKRGDSIFDKELKKNNGDLSFVTKNVRDILKEDDLTIANFETTLTTAPVYKKNNDFVFSAPPEYVEVLKHGSIEAVAFENNHAIDHGEAGIEQTQSVLTDAGIIWSTEAHPGFYSVKGLVIGMLSYQTFNGNYPRLQVQVPQDIAAIKQQCDIVIVSYHWGAELDYSPNDNQQQLGRLTIDAGADLVLGHHSHRINPIEEYNGKYIVYSLANFSFSGNSKPSDMSSFIFQTRFSFKDGEAMSLGFRIIPMRISSKTDYNDFVPTPYTDQRLIDNVIHVLLNNSKNLTYAVSDYPLDWE